jgi:hypothetical protein
MQSQDYLVWFEKWSRDMAAGGSGKVPGPEMAALASGPGGGKVGNRRFPRSTARGRVPGLRAAQVRKLGPIR